MSAVPVMISGVLWDHQNKSGRPVTLMGEATIAGLGVGGGPIMPPSGGGGGGGDAHPEHPIYWPPGIWGPNDPRPSPPIANVPGLPPMPDQPPTGEADDNGFIKAPPEGGGWGYHEDYGWGYYPKPGEAGPKK